MAGDQITMRMITIDTWEYKFKFYLDEWFDEYLRLGGDTLMESYNFMEGGRWWPSIHLEILEDRRALIKNRRFRYIASRL